MALTIEATTGGASANSFVTEAEAIAYMAARLNAGAWSTTTTGGTLTELEKKALIEAARAFDLLGWEGTRSTDTQALAWPREYAVNPDATISDPATEYPYYANDVVPQRVKDAACEYALELLRANADSRDPLQLDTTPVKRRSRVEGAVDTEYFEPPRTPRGWAAYPRIVALIGPLLESTGGIVRT